MRKFLLVGVLIVTYNLCANEFDIHMGEKLNNLGVTYEKKENYSMAIQQYKIACEKNFYRACSNLGYLYQNGFGIKKDESKALILYRKACMGKNPMGCFNLGTTYRDGLGVEIDYKKSKDLFEVACENKHYEACTSLAVQYDRE